MDTGVALLVAASLWNARPRRQGREGCTACAPSVQKKEQGDKDDVAKRTIEVFSAGCPACEDRLQVVNSIACESCEVIVLDMRDSEAAKRAKQLGVRSAPAVVINGQLAECCTGRGVDTGILRAAGVGQPLPQGSSREGAGEVKAGRPLPSTAPRPMGLGPALTPIRRSA